MKLTKELTDSGLGAGEAAVLGDQVGVVALAGQNLEHLGHFLSAAPLGASVNSKSNIRSVASKLPPQEAAGCFDVILQLERGPSADGHAAVVLNFHRVLDIVGLWHRAAIIDLERDTRGYSKQ